jgi:hypothetical protein
VHLENLVTLRDKSTGKLFKNSVHLDRLNIAYVRAPNPGNFFLPRVTTDDKNRQDDQPPNADLIKLNVPTNHEADSSFILNSIAAEQGTESNSLSDCSTSIESTGASQITGMSIIHLYSVLSVENGPI